MGVKSRAMPTYLVKPPPFDQRMAFMDALEDAAIDYSRETEGYLVYLRESQREQWQRIAARHCAAVLEKDPPMLFG